MMSALLQSSRRALAVAAQRGSQVRTEMTRAVVLEEKNVLRLRDIDVDEPFTADDVRIDIHSVGICGSDVHYYELKQPMILGHEASGLVTQVGENVTHLKVGDRVCMEPGVPLPNSPSVLRGQYNLCRGLRFWATPPPAYATNLTNDPSWGAGHGCLRASVVHPGAFTFKLPDNVSLDWGAMVEPLAVGVHSCTKAHIRPGDVAVVSGAGPIGMLTTMAALASGASHVYVIDLNPRKCQVAESLVPGCVTGVHIGAVDPVQAILEATNGRGADVIFECAGNHKSAQLTTKYAANGARIMLIGCPPTNPVLDVGDMQVKELSVQGVFRYANVYPQAIALLGSGKIPLDSIITDHFNFDDSVKAFDYMVKPDDHTIKSVIHVKSE
ncbi:uncharacterized protein MONBRDRAFT_9871 [Monosiga brevicollis MX1]|uniref:Enoyl reductase (ER) domain-containing protein n=1 Tax=Monosiga brevicollis TaxID=81824 RepID=A9V4H2_MONBE|nr:uncharacterized protein MONBRDRAFT_9871 [Monosiga brevicollis MX1]EDQ87709.1 predicted protein [Monosiga brevicollis MX1]|eukprot:XP_001747629.1 hypothetical protein [Monosiga brevicollis MX1]